MKIQVILMVTLAVIIPKVMSSNNDCERNPEWQAYKAKFDKQYSSKEEENRRCLIWQENYDDVQRHNADNSKSYRKAVNHFADQTKDERKRSRGLIMPQGLEKLKSPIGASVGFPTEWDWREWNAVTQVKNQGNCGSCWSFAVVGVVESQYYFNTLNLISFSEQQFVDCDKLDYACNGGWPYNTFLYLNKTGGLETAANYKYVGRKRICKYSKRKAIKMKITGLYTIDDSSELTDETIQSWIYNYGPLSVAVCSSQEGFMTYDSGVYPGEEACVNIDHAVLLTGYVNNGTSCYYIMKNSWGVNWGMNGYMYISCGSFNLVQHPTVATISV